MTHRTTTRATGSRRTRLRLAEPPPRAVSAFAADAVAAVADFHEDAPDGTLAADVELRREMVAMAAYYIAEQRGFAPGHEIADWLAAEAAVEATLTAGTRG